MKNTFPFLLAAAVTFSAQAAFTLLDFSDPGKLRVRPSMSGSGAEGTTFFTDRFASPGTKCFYFGTPPDKKLLYSWAVTVISWDTPVDFTKYDRAVLDYVNAAVEGDSLSVQFGSRVKGSVNVTERLANFDAGQFVMPLSFKDPAWGNAVTQMILTVGNPGVFNIHLDRVTLLEKGEPVPPSHKITDAERETLNGFIRENEAKVAEIIRKRQKAEAESQRVFRDKFRAASPGDGMMVGLATSMDQVKPCATEIEPRAAERVEMRMARGESEAVQIYVMPRGDEKLADVSVAFSGELVRDEPWWSFRGAARLGGDSLETCVVGHLNCKGRVVYKRGYVEGGGADFKRKTRPLNPGWYPDPLLSFKKSCDIDPMVCQAFYVRVKAPESAEPGTYRGKLLVTASNASAVEVPVMVRVNSFAVPRESALPLAVTFGPMVWAQRQWQTQEEYDFLRKVQKSPEAPVNAWKRHADEWADFLAERYVMPSSIYHGRRPLPFADKLAQYRREGRLGWFCLGYYGYPASLAPEDLERWKKSYMTLFRTNHAIAAKLGIADRAYIYGCDEVRKDKLPYVEWAVNTIKAEFPDVPVSTTAFDPEFGTGGSKLARMDWFIPLTSSPYYSGNEAAIARARKEGKKVWWYIACGEKAPRANVFVETQPSELRSLLSAQSWKAKADGFLYFETTIWNAAHPIPADTTPFTEWPAQSWRRGASFHGDGTMVYCGPDSTPLSSLHFEALRDGVEDYAYLKLLSDKLAAHPDAPWAAQAKRLLSCEQVRSVYDFDDTPARHYAWRDAMADILENAE